MDCELQFVIAELLCLFGLTTLKYNTLWSSALLLHEISGLAPSRVIAVGRHAEAAVSGSIYVRHPSRGGQAKFAEAMKEIYEIAN